MVGFERFLWDWTGPSNLFVEKGTFLKETSGVAGTDQTVTLVNTSLAPKVLWLWTTGQTADATYTSTHQVSYGFSDGTTVACLYGASLDNVGTTSTRGSVRRDSIVNLRTTTDLNAVAARANLLSFGTGQFTLDWINSDTNASIIHYMVMGGTAITDVKVKHYTTNTTATGNIAYTDVGFRGDFVNFLISSDAVIVTNGNDLDWNFSIGAATSSSARWAFGASSEHNILGASDTYNFKEITSCLAQWLDTTGAVSSLADFVSFDGDGFTLNWTNAPASSACVFASLIIKGGLWDVGNFTKPTATGTQDIAITAGRNPAAIMLFSCDDTTTSSGAIGEANNRISIGGSDGTTEGTIWAGDTDGVTPTVSARNTKGDKVILTAVEAATAASSTTTGEADVTDMTSDDKVTIDWTTADANAYGMFYFVVSTVSTAPPVVSAVARRIRAFGRRFRLSFAERPTFGE